jgi:Xaa-Pro dipeptidase
MTESNIAFVMFEDMEGRRDSSIRWLTGHPGDALFMLTSNYQSILVAWDLELATRMADVGGIIGYNQFDRHAVLATCGVAEYLRVPFGSRLEIPPCTPYMLFLRYVEILGDYDVTCREDGVHAEVARRRAVKDQFEIDIYRRLSRITNDLIEFIEIGVRSKKLANELDVALFIEAMCRERGCEGTGFHSIVAGPERSFGIHAFPAYTTAPFGTKGLSIVDFGLSYQGYTSDVTLTFACPPLSRPQIHILTLTEKAYRIALGMVANGVETKDISRAVDKFFGDANKAMLHGLGHGIGLEAHEAPSLSSRSNNDWVLAPGMVFTLEPGLYDKKHGGCRLENDILLTEAGVEVLTKSRIIRL